MRKSAVRGFAIEGLEDRRLFAASLAVAQSLMVFNAVKSSSASPVETLTLTNTGDAALSLNGVSVVNDPSSATASAARFAVVNAAAVPGSIAAGQSFTLQVDYSAAAVGIDSALLDINSSDPVNPLQTVQLHGIGTAGTGGTNQPSLERILQAYDEANYNEVGETDPTNALYPEPPAANSDEVVMQELQKAGSGPVTIQVLASFTAAATKPYILGTYNPEDPSNSKQPLFYTPTSESQSVYVQPQGVTSFDPGSSVFGFYNPSQTVKVNNALVTGYTQDPLNTWDTTDMRKFRFFPLLDASGNPVANSYIMTSTEWYNPSGYDFTNLVAIVSNVEPANGAPTGPVLSITNPDALPGSNTLIFNRIQNPNTTYGDVVHDSNTLTLENTGAGSLVINNITVAATTGSNGGTQYQLVSPPTFPLTLTAGQTQTITVQFVLSQTNANGHSSNETNSDGGGGGGSVYPGVLTITSNDANDATTTLPMEAWWQEHSENENEPDLQSIVNLIAGYDTLINSSSINFLTESSSPTAGPTYYGEEVVSAYWAEADTTLPVSVVQLDAYHTEAPSSKSGFNYYLQGSSSTTSLIAGGSDDGQTLFPLNSSGNLSTGSFSTSSNFGFEVLNPNVYSDDSKNSTQYGGGGHEIRFYPVRDSSGNLVPNTYVLANDYPTSTQNFDFQDNVYLISNIRPATLKTVTSPQTTGGAAAPARVAALYAGNGVAVQWTPIRDSALTGYNVYSSLSPTSGYSLLTSSPVAGDSYLDTTALPGQTVYYRVTAVDGTGESLGTQTSVVTPGTASTNLQTIAIGESPTGSTTTVAQNSAYTVVAGGPGVSGTSDGFRFLFTAQTGDFDVAAQVNSLSVAGSYSTAGIMARSSLDANSANVYMSASPSNYRFKVRTTDGASEAVNVTGSVAYPNVWVRLARSGNTFSSYSSTNGVTWTLVGQQTVSLPTTLYLGLAVASNTTTNTTTAQLSNYGTTTIYTGPVTRTATYAATSGQPLQVAVLSTAADATGTIDPTTFTQTSPPTEGGTVSFDPSTGLLTYTPVPGFAGTESFTYTVADNNGAVSPNTLVTFDVATGGANAVADTFSTVAGKPVVLNVLANDLDSTGTLNPASVSIVSQPTSGATVTVDPSTGNITYTAPAGFSGTDTFSYTVADYNGSISTPATVTLTVSAAVTGGIVTNPVSATAVAGVATPINVLSSDSDADSTLLPSTVTIVSAPSNGGTVSVNSTTGLITYTAAASFDGTETFAYTVGDAAGATSAATLVTVAVSNPGLAPVTSSSNTVVAANGSTTINIVPTTVTTVGLDLSTLTVTTPPANGTATVNANGTITYTPHAGFVGPDLFTYTVADTNGHTSNTATVDVNTGVMVGNATGDDKSLSFTNAAGVFTTVTLSRGSAELMFSNTGSITTTKQGRATVSGADLQISGIMLTGTTAASVLNIAGRGGSTIDVSNLTDTGPIGSIVGPKVVLGGSISLSGATALRVGGITGAQLHIGGGTPAVSITAGAVSDSTVVSAVPIKLLKVASWSTDGTTTSAVTAPSIGTLSSAGAFQAALELTGSGADLTAAQINGTLGAVAWRVSGSARTLSAASVAAGFSASVAGTLSTLLVRGGGFGGMLTVGTLGTLNVAGGLTGTVAASTAKTVHVAGNVNDAKLAFSGGGTSLAALSVTGALAGTTLTTAGSIGTISAASMTGDTVLAGAAAGTTLGTVTAANIGSGSINALRVTSHAAGAFADTSVITGSLNAGVLGMVDTSNNGTPTGVAVKSATSITGSANGALFKFNKASTATVHFSDFEIELVTA